MPRSAHRATPTALDRAIADHQAGRLTAAAAAYRALLDKDPTNPDALHLLGMLACEHGDAPGALSWIDAAIAQDPTRAAFHNTRAHALIACNDFARAEAAYRRALHLRPNSAEIANNLACLLRDRGNPHAAVACFSHAHALDPGSAEIAVNLAQALADTGDHAAGLTHFQRALLLRPNSADAHYGLGRAQLVLGLASQAEASFRAAIKLRRTHVASHNNLGVALDRQGQGAAAAQCFADALRCDPTSADAHYNLGCLLVLDNLLPDARHSQDRAIACAPLHGPARWARVMAELPVIYDSTAQIEQRRACYDQALADLTDAALQSPPLRAALAAGIGSSQPFFLPYQGQCDIALQARYGALLTALIDPDPAIALATPPGPGERIHLGIVTGFACEHTLWRLMIKGWLAHIDRGRFSVALYHTGGTIDAQTSIARQLADRYVGGPTADVRAAILADRPHALLYPELGMDPACARLAAERLAPLQCLAWGQPQTSGLPSIDVFLSSAAMEPQGASLHYTERLVCLPNLGVHPMLQRPDPEPITRAQLGLRDDATVFWCGQALPKYLPQHDAVFTRIAHAVPDSQFLFIGFARSTITSAQFRRRITAAFAAAGLDPAHHCVFADPMSQARFHGTARLSDIVLDSIGWSGGKSTLDLLDDCPVIVTYEGGLMRARHTAGILRCVGMTDTIAASIDGFVDLAIRYARAPDMRARLRTRMQTARLWLLGDLSPIRALENFLDQAVPRHG